jgi:hypothetical protein
MKIIGIRKSLKLIGVQLKWHKLQELPYNPEKWIEEDEINTILKYNLNDVEITEQLYYKLKEDIDLRVEISNTYDINAYSESRSGIANRMLEKMYTEATGLPKKFYKDMRTIRPVIPLTLVIEDRINFKTKGLQKFLNELKSTIFYKDLPFYTKTVSFDGNKYNIGLGGIHSNDSAGYFEETEDTFIMDADVASEYPSKTIVSEIFPEHLGPKFLHGFKDLRDRRVKAKHEGKKVENECLKIVLNSTIGKFLQQESWMYDPLANMRVTINCQLYMLMLIERLQLAGIHSISANTDGVTALVKKDQLDVYHDICKKWEQLTGLELEFTKYKKYIRRDVNNYIAIKEGGKIKTKGIFNNDLDFLKGFDKPIISIALYEYFINNKPIAETIKNHKDIYDFCVAKKIDDKFENYYNALIDNKLVAIKLQNVLRYYVSTNGVIAYKKDKENKEYRYEAKDLVTIFDDYIKSEDYHIDYNHYISETQKIIDEIIPPQLTLF